MKGKACLRQPLCFRRPGKQARTSFPSTAGAMHACCLVPTTAAQRVVGILYHHPTGNPFIQLSVRSLALEP